MARLTEHMLEELSVLERQAKIAAGHKDIEGQMAVEKLLDSLAGLIDSPKGPIISTV